MQHSYLTKENHVCSFKRFTLECPQAIRSENLNLEYIIRGCCVITWCYSFPSPFVQQQEVISARLPGPCGVFSTMLIQPDKKQKNMCDTLQKLYSSCIRVKIYVYLQQYLFPRLSELVLIELHVRHRA